MEVTLKSVSRDESGRFRVSVQVAPEGTEVEPFEILIRFRAQTFDDATTIVRERVTDLAAALNLALAQPGALK